MNNNHYEYDDAYAKWRKCRVAWLGEEEVKSHKTTFLPATKGMLLDGYPNREPGLSAYNNYILRSEFKNYFAEKVTSAIGMLNKRKAVFNLPNQLDYMRYSSNLRGDTLDATLRNIHNEVLITGRCGILTDVDESGSIVLSIYTAENILDWEEQLDGNLTYLSLNESTHERGENGVWNEVEYTRKFWVEEDGVKSALFNVNGEMSGQVAPMSSSGYNLSRIPFTIINTSKIGAEVEKPPLLDLANKCYAIYRKSADINQVLFMQGQETAVIVGVDEDVDIEVGAGALVRVPMGGDFKYVGISAAGLSEMREDITRMEQEAQATSTKLLDSAGAAASGEALRLRLDAAAVTLGDIAHSSAEGLTQALKFGAEYINLSTEDIYVEPNTEFTSQVFVAQELKSLVEAKNAGAKISDQNIHDFMVSKGLLEDSFEEVLEQLRNETQESDSPDNE